MEGKDDRGLQNLILAAKFVESGSQAGLLWQAGPFAVHPAPKASRRPGRKRVGKISRFQHNQLEKDRRANLRSNLEALAEELSLDDKKTTTLLVLEAATKEIDQQKRKDSQQSTLWYTEQTRSENLKLRLEELQKIASVKRQEQKQQLRSRQPSPTTLGVPPSPPNSEHSICGDRLFLSPDMSQVSPVTPGSSPSASPAQMLLGTPVSDDGCFSVVDNSKQLLYAKKPASHFTFGWRT